MVQKNSKISSDLVVTTSQMQAIEASIFAAGMPVAALMEKVGGLVATWISHRFPLQDFQHIAVLVGPGHNGGDALVVARELGERGYQVEVCCPCDLQKDLTAAHLRFIQSLGIPVRAVLPGVADLYIDGLFGFGLDRPVGGTIADLIRDLNSQSAPVVSIDIPSGLHTDTGAVLGIAVRATHSLCLGLWKRAFCQDRALAYLGERHLIDFDIPGAALQAGLGATPPVRCLSPATALARLPWQRSAATHKYQVGHLLLVAGSRQYGGAALLAGLGARASGVGMVTVAVPESLRLLLLGQLPEALVIGCAETTTGAIAALPDHLDLSHYQAIAGGPGLSTEAGTVVETLLSSPTPLLLDADGLNLLATLGVGPSLGQRSAPSLITPHPGEFRRLFPGLLETATDAGHAAQLAAAASGAIVLLKGACTAIAHPDGRLWFNTASTPALARGGSGDVLTGLIGGLLAQAGTGATLEEQKNHQKTDTTHTRIYPSGPPSAGQSQSRSDTLTGLLDAALGAAWWHGQTAQQLVQTHTILGVDGCRLAAALTPTLATYRP
ncbi:MAG: NAD(P)H-hydrate dehydratase [Nodosilinea sp.]